MRMRSLLLRTVIMLLTTTAVPACAQEQEHDLVYRFRVQGITDRESAKPVQYAMMDQGFVHACEFIPECTCFKLASPNALGYEELRSLLVNSGFDLMGPVHVSDGTVMVPTAPVIEAK